MNSVNHFQQAQTKNWSGKTHVKKFDPKKKTMKKITKRNAKCCNLISESDKSHARCEILHFLQNESNACAVKKKKKQNYTQTCFEFFLFFFLKPMVLTPCAVFLLIPMDIAHLYYIYALCGRPHKTDSITD